MTDLTKIQARVLRYINRFRAKEQCNPTVVEITNKFGWASPNNAQQHLDLMERKGVIRRRAKPDGRNKISRGYIVTSDWERA